MTEIPRLALTRQREARDFRHPHRLRPILRHPDWQLRQRAVGLANGQSDFITMAIAPRNNDRFAATGMKSVADDGLTRLIVGIMKSFRRRRARSLGLVASHRLWRA